MVTGDQFFNKISNTSIKVDRKSLYYIRKDNEHPYAAENETAYNYDYTDYYYVWLNCDGNGSVLVYHPSGSNQWGIPYEIAVSKYPPAETGKLSVKLQMKQLKIGD